MKNEDLIKKLESARLPEAELHTHRRLLKTALLEKFESSSNKTAAAAKRRKIPIMNTIKGFLGSNRPVWQKALVSTSAVFVLVIAAMAVTMSPLVRDYEAMAMEVALNDSEVQEIIEDEAIDTDNIKIAALVQTPDYIEYYIRVSDNDIVVVRLSTGVFTTKIVDLIKIETMPISNTKKQEVLEIARTDPEIKALLDQGVNIYMYYFDYIPAYIAGDGHFDFTGDVKALQPLAVQDQEAACEGFVEYKVRFWMEHEGTRYFVQVDMLSKTVFSTSSWPIEKIEKEDKTAIAKELVLNDPQVQALLGNAEIDAISVKDGAVADIYATVVIKVNDDRIIIANVINGSDGNKEVEIVENEVVPVTDAKKQEIIDIAGTDPELKNIFDEGASVFEYYFDYIPSGWLNDDGSGIRDDIGGLSPISIENHQIVCNELAEWTIRCWIEFDETIYFFQLDMLNKTIDWTDSVPASLYHSMMSMTTTASTTTSTTVK